jgi:D-alanine transaminase
VIDGELITPPKNNDILAGITRDVILELAAAEGLPHREDIIAFEGLQSATEIWVTSSTREIVPVIALNDVRVGDGKPGPVFSKMDEWFQNYKRSLA